VELLRTVQSMSIRWLVLRYSDVGDVDVLVCTVETGDASRYTQVGNTTKYLCGCQNVCTCTETLHYCGTRHFGRYGVVELGFEWFR